MAVSRIVREANGLIVRGPSAKYQRKRLKGCEKNGAPRGLKAQ
jgi:hypothetical protein